MLLGLSPFLIVELTLRLFDLPASRLAAKASDDPLVDLHQLKPLFVDDGSGQWRIANSRYNFFRPASFDVVKSNNEFRVFVLGGSTVQGRPYQTETAFPMWLEIALNTIRDEKDFDTINCGGISYASYRLAPILDEVLNHEPDLIILYIGHNEFLEDRTYASFKSVPRPLARATQMIGDLRTTQLISHWTAGENEPAWVADAEVKARLDVADGLNQYARDVDWRSSVIEHFRQTMDRMVAACQRQNVPLILCVPASNIDDTPPFKVSQSPSLTPEQAVQFRVLWEAAQAEGILSNRRLELCREALEIDPHHAGAAYVAGRLLLDSRQPSEADQYLMTAKDWDVCPLRAPSEIEAAVRQIGTDRGVPVIDTPARMRELYPNGRLSDQQFVDHVHPTIRLHQEIAVWLLEVMDAQRLLNWSAENEPAMRAAFAKHLDSLDPAYFARGRQRLEGLRQWAAGRAGEMSID